MPNKLTLTLSALVVLGFAVAAVAGEPAPADKDEKTATIGTTAPQVALKPGERTSVDFKGESLKDVLDFLSTRSGMNVRALDDKTLELKVTFKLDAVTWRDILEFMAEKYKLIVDTSKEAAGIIIVKSPPKVSIEFPKPTDVRVVIASIAAQTDANLIIGPDVKGTVSLSLKDVPWEEALDMVVRTVDMVAVKDKFNTYRITTPAKIATQLETQIFRLSYIQPEGSRYVATIDTPFAERKDATPGGATKEPISLLGVLKEMVSKQGKVNYERRSNTLVIVDSPTKLQVMAKLIEKVDIPPKQVHLAVRMVELTDSESEDLGMEWANGFTGTLTGMAFDTMFPFNSTGGDNAWTKTVPGRYGVLARQGSYPRRLDDPLLSLPEDLGKPTLGRLDLTGLRATLRFVKTKTSGSIIQAPSIIALDNEEATIHVGKNIRYAEYFTESTDGGGISSGYREANDSPIKEGVQVLVVPHVTGPDGNVILTIIPKSENLDTGVGQGGFVTFGAGDTQISLPQTVQRIVVTKMMLRDMETGVIAGLKKTISSTAERKVPFLGDIPVLGWLFKSRSRPAESNQRLNMMIFVTPTVIDLQKEMRIPSKVRTIRRELAGPFFTYDEKVTEREASAPKK
jgi:type IV pilus assembly protein PilQ